MPARELPVGRLWAFDPVSHLFWIRFLQMYAFRRNSRGGIINLNP